nr:MAG TPA: hypothetical protein [Caudoviricetes sp.]
MQAENGYTRGSVLPGGLIHSFQKGFQLIQDVPVRLHAPGAVRFYSFSGQPGYECP